MGPGGIDIGPLGNIEGRVVGLNAAAGILSDLAPIGAERAFMAGKARKAGKDYNDQAAAHTVGSQDGQAVKEKPVSWMPSW